MLKKTNVILMFFSVLFIIIIVIALITRSLKSSPDTETVPIISTSENSQISVLTKPNYEIASTTKKAILPKLPIRITDFQTSVGLTTNIYISSFLNDSPETVRIEIFGIDYLPNQNDPATNLNMVAFKESFEKVISVLKENGVDISDLRVSLSNKEYIRNIAEIWIKTLNLLP